MTEHQFVTEVTKDMEANGWGLPHCFTERPHGVALSYLRDGACINVAATRAELDTLDVAKRCDVARRTWQAQ
jgi:hypothetical protein